MHKKIRDFAIKNWNNYLKNLSNHLSKSLFSIPRLKKSRSRQQNQPENPTSLCLNALTADDAFLRFAAALGEPFFSSRNPERNFIFSLYIHPPQPRPEAPALHYNIFGLIGRLSPRGAQGLPTCRIHPTIVPEMRCAAPKRRNFPARKRYGRHTSGRRDGHTRWIQEKTVSIGAAGDIIIWKYGTAESARGR